MQEYNRNMLSNQEVMTTDLKDYSTPKLIAMGGIPHVVRGIGTIGDDGDKGNANS